MKTTFSVTALALVLALGGLIVWQLCSAAPDVGLHEVEVPRSYDDPDSRPGVAQRVSEPVERVVAFNDESVLGAVVQVVDTSGRPVSGCRVVATGKKMRSARAIESKRSLAALDVVFDGFADDEGLALIRFSEPGDVNVRVRTPDGVFAVGPDTVAGGDGVTARYVVPQIVGCAFHLSDGAVSRHVSYQSEELAPAGQDLRTIRSLSKDLAKRMGLSANHVHVGLLPKSSDEPCRVTLRILHPRIGWFRAVAAMMPLTDMRPVVVEVPSEGVATPVAVTVNCLGPDGEPVKGLPILVSGGEMVGGFPAISDEFQHGETHRLIPGRFSVRPLDAALAKAMANRDLVEVMEDCEIVVQLKWLSREIEVALRSSGEGLVGAATATVSTIEGRLYRRRIVEVVDGKIGLSIPTGRSVTVDVRGSGQTGQLSLSGQERGQFYIIEMQ